jgi:hypothetical protein
VTAEYEPTDSQRSLVESAAAFGLTCLSLRLARIASRSETGRRATRQIILWELINHRCLKAENGPESH